MNTRRRPVVVPALLAAVLGGACATNPATGERQLSLVSVQQEVALGREASQQVQQTVGLVPNQALQEYVTGVGRRLAKDSERPDLPWTFGVVEDPGANAFALPGGFIYITRGLMDLLTTEAQLASVLGHEIGHVTARHSVEQISRAQLTQLGLGLGGALFPEVQQFSPLVGAGLNLLFLKYGRDDERQADELGFGYIRAHGYDVSEFPDVFVTLERASKESERGLPGWLSTHPTSEERIAAARARVAAADPQQNARVGREAYLQAIDGLVYGDNPRNGFFRETMFYQPDLRLQLRFPSGWRTQNLTNAVVGVAPDGAAAIELSIAGTGGNEQALTAFARQNNVQVGDVSRERFNGQPALAARFRAAAQNGQQVDGYVAFVEHLDRTYQVVGYAAASAFGTYAEPIVQAIQSFATVTDPEILSVQPRRIDIVKIDRGMTLTEFARAYPSAVPPEQLAVLNHVSDAASDRLPAGTLVKRVVS